MALPVFGLLVIQDHLSAMMITAVIVAVIVFTAGARIPHLIPLGGAAGAAAFLYAYTSEFRRKRLMIFLDPWQDPQNNGWQIIQSLYAIGSGGLFGVGLGKGVQKYMYIAEPHNDFILSTWAEETGLVGVILVILLFAVFIWRGIVIAMKAPDLYGSLVAIGITGMIGIQAIFNIAVISSSMPVTGISLPFFSYGGSALVILLSSVGVLLSISRQAKQH
ncbi:MAG: FtsW/RodA/SpoVE family cell cycle protein [Clostridia bacterium]|nr:FtsW/RodA/SpoVE family cell cycle protein [Clostridia bacterium]